MGMLRLFIENTAFFLSVGKDQNMGSNVEESDETCGH